MSGSFNDLRLLDEIERSSIPLELKIDVLKDLSRARLPGDSEVRKRLEALGKSDGDREKAFQALKVAMRWLILHYSSLQPVGQEDWQKDIETEVRLSLDERFTKSPYFIAMAGMLAGCITLFGFGLFSLNKDVKSADEQVSRMQQQVTSATIAMNTMQANEEVAMSKSSQDFDERIKATESRIADAERDVTSIIGTRFEKELDEVNQAKEETLKSINLAGGQATTDIKSTENTLIGQLNRDAADRVAALEAAKANNLTRINQRGAELYYNLQKPTWKDLLQVGLRVNWPLWVVSLLGLILSVVALVRPKRK